MRFRLLCMVLIVHVFLVFPALAQNLLITNGGGGFACLTESGHDELMKAINAKNYSWAQSMLDGGQCIRMKNGLRATIKDYGMLGLSEIYLHPLGGGRPITVWTVNENFKTE